MTSGVKTGLERSWLAGLRRLLGIGLLAWAATAPAAALDLAELMGILSKVRSGEARFTEQRQVKGLDAPLVSSGTLSFSAPDRFTRKTLVPKPEGMEVEGNMVTLSRGGRSRTFVLDASPETEAIVEAVRGTLTGNAQSLQQHFKVKVGGSPEQWTMELQPIAPRLQVLLSSVRIAGRRAELRTVEMLMADGDRSLMQIEPMAAGSASAPDKRP
jgi:outer membrane lipoprotein-sorting protein